MHLYSTFCNMYPTYQPTLKKNDKLKPGFVIPCSRHMSIHAVKHSYICRASITVDFKFSETFLVGEFFSIANGTVFFRE